jgi:Fe-S-cluster-containing hydrogenase component 2
MDKLQRGIIYMGIKVVHRRCPANHPCPSVMVCPVGALTQKGYDAPLVDNDKCVDCGRCINFCPMGALVLE